MVIHKNKQVTNKDTYQVHRSWEFHLQMVMTWYLRKIVAEFETDLNFGGLAS